MQEGDKVLCKRGNIDKNAGAGLVGIIEGFARFSAHHGREAFVRFGPRAWEGAPHEADGWFWLSDLDPVATEG